MACSSCGGSRTVSRPAANPVARQTNAGPQPGQTFTTQAPGAPIVGAASSPGYPQPQNPNAPVRKTV